MKLIQTIDKLTTYPVGDRDSDLDVAIWHSDTNACEFHEEGCLTHHGIYFGTSDSREPKFCPLHYFGETGYVLEVVEKDDFEKRLEESKSQDLM